MLITIPPPQMVANMKVGKMDGFCVGEPWNARAVNDKRRATPPSPPRQLWKDHPEKVCAFTRRIRGQESEDGEGRPQGLARGSRCGWTT
jgi:nitrate/nitrite transport system substrate-binding protein